MGLWPYYSNARLYGNYANEANLHKRTKVHGQGLKWVFDKNSEKCVAPLRLLKFD